MKKPTGSTDPDILGSYPALRRAAKAAHRLAVQTGTPLYIWQDGKVVDINPVRRKRANPRRRAKSG
jgi:hypothetical protein